MIVVDASVSIKWFVPEEDSEIAVRLLRLNQKLIAPDIIREEVVSGITRKVRREEIMQQDAHGIILEWDNALNREMVKRLDYENLLMEAAELSFTLKHPLYDCLYLALSIYIQEQRGICPLITADKTFHKRCQEVGYKQVYPLNDKTLEQLITH